MSENKANSGCPCTNEKCANRCKCAQCQANHKEKGNLPFCQRPKE